MKNKRISAIDLMRGLSLLGMMLVNLTPDEGSTYSALVHTEWTGISLADVFFPCFLFLAGVSVAVSLKRKVFGNGWFRAALKRGAMLILIGMVYNHLPCIWSLIFNPGYGFSEFFRDVTDYFRFFGVLQRIGFAYFFGILIYHFAKTEKRSLAAAFALLAVTSAGFFLYRFSDPFSETDNISILLDQMVQGSSHNYLKKVFDPEGLYGNFTAIASMLFGMVAGVRLRDGRRMASVGLGCALALLGWFASAWIPVSKPLWTASYVLVLSGAFMILFPVLDDRMTSCSTAKGWTKLPMVLGSHSMLTYLVSGSVEAFLNAVEVGDTNLYHVIWQNTTFSEAHLALSCLLCSLLVIAVVCGIVCAAVFFGKRARSHPGVPREAASPR